METRLARDLTSDEEWAFFERFIRTVRAPNGRKPTNHRLVLDGIFWIARTGSPWRDLPEEFGKWSSVYRQFRRWTLAGLWEQIMDALIESGAVPHALQMIDSPWFAPIIHCPTGHCASNVPRGGQRALEGDSATGFWPLKSVRWENSPLDCFLDHLPLHDQDPSPSQCSRAAHEDGDNRGANLRLSRLRSGHGGQHADPERPAGRPRL